MGYSTIAADKVVTYSHRGISIAQGAPEQSFNSEQIQAITMQVSGWKNTVKHDQGKTCLVHNLL